MQTQTLKTADHSFHQQTLLRLKPVMLLSELTGIVSCVFALVLVDLFRDLSPWLYACPGVALLAVYLSYRAQTLIHLWLSGSMMLFACSVCVAHLANAWGDPTFWFLPIGLVVTLPAAVTCARLAHYIGTSAVIWVTLLVLMQPDYADHTDLIPVLLIIASAMSAAIIICRELNRDRLAIFTLQRQLYDMAYIDTLTGIPNRRAFMERLAQRAETQTSDTLFYFLMLDIDNFKSINDSLGHDTGDQVLVKVAEIVQANSDNHNFARIGGEEFAVAACLPDLEAARNFGQAFVDAINSSPVLGLNVSLSIGVAEQREGESMTSLMRRSDLALYRAKQAGKNRYEVAE